VLRDLAEGNSHRVQEWFDRVAETDPAEAARLWLALLRFVTPTLQAAAIADLTPPNSTKDMQKHLCQFTDDELMQIIAKSSDGKSALPQRGSTHSPNLPIHEDEADDPLR